MKKLCMRPCDLFKLRRLFGFLLIISLVVLFLMYRARVTEKPHTLAPSKNSGTQTTASNKTARDLSQKQIQKNATLPKTTENLDRNKSNYSCLYTGRVSGNIKTWQSLLITIAPTQLNNCQARSQIKFHGGTTFRVQAFSVHEIVTGDVIHTGNDNYKAKLILTFIEEYTVMVVITFINNQSLEYKTFVPAIIDNIKGTPFKLRTMPGVIPADITRYCTQQESGLEPGRWILCGSVPGIEKCGKWQLNHDYDFDKIHNFHWLPYRCQLHHYTDDQIKKCFATNRWRNLTFTGDSHSRYRTYHWVTRLYGTCQDCIKTHVKTVFDKIPGIEWVFDARGTRWPLIYPNISRPHEIYIVPSTRRSMFSQPIPNSALEAQVIIINFGHWILREVSQTDFMDKKLQAFVEAIKTLKNKTLEPVRVIFVNTMALPWRNDKGVVDWKDNLSPSRVNYLNEMMDRVIRDNDIELVNAFQISAGRVGATHDQTHFAKRFETGVCAGVVENTVSNVIANTLCNPIKS